ncbi:MAG TPA: FAD/NAD(P)-binding protein, partial [Steroidobacteraceae bacterium]
LKERISRPIAVTIMEPRGQLGAGAAYSTTCPAHLLNTRACNMSVTDDAADFVEWLRSEHRRRGFNWGAQDFAPRQYFGEYLRTRLSSIRGASNIQQTWLRSVADSVLARGNGWEVVPAQGEPVPADIVVLATGNEAPRPLGQDLAPAAQDLILNNPWASDERKADIPLDAAVLIAGTGLTAVDAIAELLHRRHTGRIVAFSRRGLLPRSHGAVAPLPESLRRAFPASLRALVKHVRELTSDDPRGERWRGVMTELRSMAPALWASWDLPEQKRFLRHVRPFWDVHRHRLAPLLHARLTRAIARGQLKIVRGRLEALEHDVAGGSLRAILRQHDGPRVLRGSVLINCTGPGTNALRAANPLLQSLVADGTARPDALELGLATDRRSRVLSRAGAVQRTLFALGTLARGSQWELTAIPEIREQARLIAREIELQAATRVVDKPEGSERVAAENMEARMKLDTRAAVAL